MDTHTTTDLDKNLDNRWNQHETRRYSNDYFVIRAGVDKEFDNKISMGAQVAYTFFTPSEYAQQSFDDLTPGTTDSYYRMDRLNGNLHLTKRWEDKSSLLIDVDYIRYAVKQDNQYKKETNGTTDLLLHNLTHRLINIGSYRIDYSKPIQKVNLLMGLSGSITNTNNDFSESKPITQKDAFHFNEGIFGAYLDAVVPFGDKFVTKMGLRGEYTRTKSEQKEVAHKEPQVDNHSSYFNLFPTLFMRYQPLEQSVLTLSYSRRISRPSFATLNPFEQKMDERTYQAGNPYLKPSYAHTIELAHTYRNNWSATVTYRVNNGVFFHVLKVDPVTKVTLYTYDNVNDNKLLIFNTSYRWSPSNYFDFYINGNIYNLDSRTMKYDTPLHANCWSYLVWGMAQINFDKKNRWVGEVSAQVMGREKYAESTTNARYYIDLGLKYQALDGRLNVSASISNLLSNSPITTYSDGSFVRQETQLPLRTFRLSLSYSFGKDFRQKSYGNKTIVERL